MPGDLFNRAVVAATAEVGRVVPHDALVLALGDIVFADAESVKAGLFAIGGEAAAGDVYHFTPRSAALVPLLSA